MWCNIFRRFFSAAVAQRKIPISNNKILNARSLQFGSIPTQTATQNDVLTTQLTSASTPKRIFELISINIRSMNNDHLIKVLSVLYNMRKMSSSNDILGEAPFRDICSRLLMRARFYDVDQSLKVLQYLSALGVPTESAVFQAYLQMMRHYINDLNLPQIIFLNFLLQKQSATKLVVALKKALPMVAENVLQDQLSSCNQWHVVQLYLLAAQTRMREDTLRTIANHLVDCGEPLTANNATFVLWALAKNYFWDDQCTMMADMSFSALTSSLDQLDRKVLHYCLGRLNHAQLYNEEFLETVTKKALLEKWDLQETHNLARILTYHEHFHPKFLDYYSKLVEESFSAADKSPVPIQAVVETFATPCYKPYNWNSVWEILSQERFITQLQLSDKMSLLRLAINFAAMGKVPNELLRVVFEGIDQSEQIDIEKDRDLLLLWHMANKSLQITYSQVGNLIMKMNERNFVKEEGYNPSLRAALAKSMDGSHFVNTKQKTNSGIVIDHLIVFDTNGIPVAINSGDINSDICVELQLPADFTKVAILEKDCNDYLKNVELPNEKSALEESVLRNLGFLPIPIKLKSWLGFPEKERIPYLTRAIKLALEMANKPSNFCK